MTKKQAEAKGYLVDTTVYPWMAYKGARFAPSDWMRIKTPAFSPKTDNQKLRYPVLETSNLCTLLG